MDLALKAVVLTHLPLSNTIDPHLGCPVSDLISQSMFMVAALVKKRFEREKNKNMNRLIKSSTAIKQDAHDNFCSTKLKSNKFS